MLSEKNIKGLSRHVMSMFLCCLDNKTADKKNSRYCWIIPDRAYKNPVREERALCSASCCFTAGADIGIRRRKVPASKKASAGSATVEASLILPVFLFAICSLILIGQMMIADGSIAYSTAQTARVCAVQESVKQASNLKKSSGRGSPAAQTSSALDSAKNRWNIKGTLTAKALFQTYLKSGNLTGSCIVGGRAGIVLTESVSENMVIVKAKYVMHSPFPGYQLFLIRRTVTSRRRIFNGYSSGGTAEGESGSGEGDQVYVARTGTVYHTNPECYHIMIHINDPRQIQSIMTSKKYKPCSKCIKKGTIPSSLYTTADGDHYHASKSCSGLKRSIHTATREEVAGMRECSECAKHHH